MRFLCLVVVLRISCVVRTTGSLLLCLSKACRPGCPDGVACQYCHLPHTNLACKPATWPRVLQPGARRVQLPKFQGSKCPTIRYQPKTIVTIQHGNLKYPIVWYFGPLGKQPKQPGFSVGERFAGREIEVFVRLRTWGCAGLGVGPWV